MCGGVPYNNLKLPALYIIQETMSAHISQHILELLYKKTRHFIQTETTPPFDPLSTHLGSSFLNLLAALVNLPSSGLGSEVGRWTAIP